MRDPTIFDKIDLHLIRVLHTVLTERSVSRAAIGRPWPVGFARMRYIQLWHEPDLLSYLKLNKRAAPLSPVKRKVHV